jgi:hypothetical protein
MTVRRLSIIVVVMLASAIAAASAAAGPIAGATYNGTAASGARVTFTVSPDGTLVTSYRIGAVAGGPCQILAEGDNGVWPGAPIVANAFTYSYSSYSAITFSGSFTGAQSASGTFRLDTPRVNGAPGCDTGTVDWTASTSAAAPPGSGGSSGGGPGGGPGGAGHRHVFVTRITFRKASKLVLRGQIKSPHGACRAGRTVILWRGTRRIASTKSKAGGKFSFPRTALVRGRHVRASTPARNMQAGTCAAASSTFIKG